jgi:hypothetical protein
MYCEKYVMGFVYLTGDYDNASGFFCGVWNYLTIVFTIDDVLTKFSRRT